MQTSSLFSQEHWSLMISSALLVISSSGLVRHATPLMRQPVAFTDRPPAPPPPPGVKPQKKRHALLTFGFTGTGFWGLQSQNADGEPDKPTVTDLLRAALRDDSLWQDEWRSPKGVMLSIPPPPGGQSASAPLTVRSRPHALVETP